MSYIGALGVNTFDDEIEDVSNILVDRIVSDIKDTSNYVLVTSSYITVTAIKYLSKNDSRMRARRIFEKKGID